MKKNTKRRIFAYVLSLAMVFPFLSWSGNVTVQAAVEYVNENLLSNPGFEEAVDQSNPAIKRGNWFGYSQGDKTSAEHHGGDSSGILPVTNAALEQDLEGLQAGTTYVYTVWAKVNKVVNGACARIGVKNYGGDQKTIDVLSTEWKEYSIEFTYSGNTDARVFGFMRDGRDGTVLYIDDASVTVKSDVARVQAENGQFSVTFAGAYAGTPNADDFTANITSSLEPSKVMPLELTAGEFKDGTLLLTFPEVAEQPLEQTVTINLTYTPTGQVITLDYQVEASGEAVVEGELEPELTVENGSASAVLKENPTKAPEAQDFAWQYQIDGGEWKTLETSDFVYDKENKKVTVSFGRISSSTVDRTVKVKAVYNNTEAEGTFTIAAGESYTYYVDASKGADTNDGLSPETAFQSIDRLNSIAYNPGDQILFKRGETFTGAFQPKGSGTEGAPITIASYGDEDEARPVLKPGDPWTIPYLMSAGQTVIRPQVNHVIKFYNQEYWEVSDLELYDPDYAGVSEYTNVYRSGICVSAENVGDLEHFYFDNLEIHGFRGPRSNIGKTSGGIVMNIYRDPYKSGAEQTPTRINDIRITNCELYQLGRSGVNFLTPWARRTESNDTKWGTGYTSGHAPSSRGFAYYPYEDFYFANNEVHEIDGDGLIIDNNVNAVAENNLVYRCNLRADMAVGMFCWNSDNPVFQFNEVYSIAEGSDAQGIEIDALNNNAVVQYNYMHDNAGGSLLWCSTPSLYTFDSTFRYNIFQNDLRGHGLLDLRSGLHNGMCYNNTFYMKSGIDGNFINGENSTNSNATFANNIFYYPGEEKFTANSFAETCIEWKSNIFYGFTNLPTNADSEHPNMDVDPMLTDPGKGTTGSYAGERVDLSGYQLKEGSPAIDAGLVIEDNGGRDYFGNELTDGRPDIGAAEYVVQPVPEETPSAEFTATGDAEGTLENVEPGMRYSTDGGQSWFVIAGTEVSAGGVTPQNGIFVYRPGNGTTTVDSEKQVIKVTQAEDPEGVEATACTTSDQNDGTITGVDVSMEYKAKSDVVWTDITGSTADGLKPGTYEVRVKASGTMLASKSVTVEVKQYEAPEKPPVEEDPEQKPNGGENQGSSTASGDDKKTEVAVKTGDNSSLALWGLLLLASGAVCAGATLTVRKNKK